MKTLALPQLFREAGINVVEMDGWQNYHTFKVWTGTTYVNVPYRWRYNDAMLSMWHHTATSDYSPNRDKANMWAGLMAPSGRLYQTGGGVPTIVFANAYPAPISSGYGQKKVIDLAVNDQRNDALASGPDDVPRYAANRDAWNTEVVLDGTGTHIDVEVWEMLITAAAVMHKHFEWSENRAIGHAQFTNRKIDLRDGRDPSAMLTMMRFRKDLAEAMTGDENMLKVYDSTWMEMFHSGVPGVEGFGRYYCTNDTTVDWATETYEGLGAPWGSNPHPTAPDGGAKDWERNHALNYLLQAFANVAGGTA